MKTVVTVSRMWNHPKITTLVSNEGIALSMDMEDFSQALKTEIGAVTWVFTKAEFEKRLDEAILKIVAGIKEESIKAIHA
jgi:hypothetical protein